MANHLPVVFTSRNGKSYIKSKPPKVRQTNNSILTAGLFGKASSMASTLTATFKPLMGYPYYRDMYSRLNSALRQWMQTENSYPQSPLENIIDITGFRFIKETGIFNRFTVPIQVTYLPNGNVEVDIPAFISTEKIAAPPRCRSIELKLMAVSCSPFDKQIVDVASQNVTIANNGLQHPPMHIVLPLQAGSNTLTLLAVALKYDNRRGRYC